MTSSPAFPDATLMWNRRFDGDAFLFGTEPNAWLRDQAAVWSAGQRVLCVADGEGRNSVWLARQGLAVDAFDISDVGVAKARQFAAQQGVVVQYQVADCDHFAWPTEAYDGVAAIFIQFADPALRTRLFSAMVRCLKPGGRRGLIAFIESGHRFLHLSRRDSHIGPGLNVQVAFPFDRGGILCIGHGRRE